jgi:lysophospholipid acyltransferase (LPLAT)-like uncharacterized protein
VNWLLPLIGSWILKSLHATLRVRHIHVEKINRTPRHVLAFWHSHLLLMFHSKYRKPISVLISQSKDGELIARVAGHYGVETARGSSTRGGALGMREILKQAGQGMNIAFTPDGPKGPARVLKEGVILAAQATGLPIVPVAFAAKKKSSSDRGTGWSSRCRSRGPSSSTATRCSCRVTATSRSGGSGWNG